MTVEETEEYLRYFGYDLSDKVKSYYDGYRFGENEIYNPMSITSYISKKGISKNSGKLYRCST